MFSKIIISVPVTLVFSFLHSFINSEGVEGTREHDFTERQDIWTGPVQEKGN